MALELRPEIILLSETHVTSDINDNEVFITNYKFLRCNSNSRHTGGVAAYVQNSLKISKIEISSADESDFWRLKFTVNKTSFAVIYHSPSLDDNSFLKNFEEWLNEIELKNFSNFILCGDFNINLLKESKQKRDFLRIIDRFKLKQIQKSPTRITQFTRSLIDFIITNVEEIETNILEQYKISDHESIFICIKEVMPKTNTSFIHKRDWKKFDHKTFLEKLKSSNWYPCYQKIDCNEMVECLTSNINDSLNKICPLKCVSTKSNIKQVSYFDFELQQLKRLKNHLFNKAKYSNLSHDWHYYKTVRNQYVSMLSAKKKYFYEKQIDLNKNDSKKMWKTLKSIVSTKSKSNITEINFNGITCYNSNEIADKFNNYFVESVKEIANNIEVDNSFENDPIDMNHHIQLSTFSEVDVDFVRKIVMNLKNSKCSADEISIDLFKNSFEVIKDHLVNIINQSITTGIFPSKWKTSIVLPVPKVKNSNKHCDFRPINMLPVCEKVLEIVVYQQIEEYFTKHNLLY
ncbi:endonuclease-reverse transcriptase-like protein, partial [Dinothrombium tinctorium]